ncbi:MAG TPA: sigma-70 family RNA polymerase sigma factor [Chthonomonadaceae bacterium]|nr:sigma-70 family RNA polymerase sigma factor [Chthonomonadaceae bacterium]
MPYDDHQLVRRCLQGDLSAFSPLYDRHASHVYRLLKRLCNDDAQAEDLTQDTLVAAFRSLANWRGEGAFRSWLCGIAVRLYRQSVRDPVLLELEILDEETLLQDRESDPLDTLMQQEAARLIEQAIQELPVIYREVFVLLRIEGMAQREVATLLEIPMGTVQSRLGRAVGLLRKRILALEIVGQGTENLPVKGGEQDAMQIRA